MAADSTNQLRDSEESPSDNPLFRKLPPQYYGYALQWFEYPRWTVEETANLLTGCVPHREMFLRGESHRQLDEEVLANENLVRGALGKELRVVETKKYFEHTYLDSSNVLEWARGRHIKVPDDLIRAQRENRAHREMHGYRTPCMAALEWVVARFWEQADLRDPPTPGEVIHALLQAFPEITPSECEMIEHIARHPAARRDPENPDKTKA